MAAGVPTGLAVYPGVPRGGALLNPTADVGQRMLNGYLMALKRVLA